MEIAAQVAAAVSVSRGRVSVRICEHRGQTLALEVSLWEAQAGSSGRGSQMTASALASELMRQAFSGTSVLRSQPLLTKISAANLLLGSAKSRLGSGAPVPAIDGEANRLTPRASAFAVTPALQVERHPSVMEAHKVHHVQQHPLPHQQPPALPFPAQQDREGFQRHPSANQVQDLHQVLWGRDESGGGQIEMARGTKGTTLAGQQQQQQQREQDRAQGFRPVRPLVRRPVVASPGNGSDKTCANPRPAPDAGASRVPSKGSDGSERGVEHTPSGSPKPLKEKHFIKLLERKKMIPNIMSYDEVSAKFKVWTRDTGGVLLYSHFKHVIVEILNQHKKAAKVAMEQRSHRRPSTRALPGAAAENAGDLAGMAGIEQNQRQEYATQMAKEETLRRQQAQQLADNERAMLQIKLKQRDSGRQHMRQTGGEGCGGSRQGETVAAGEVTRQQAQRPRPPTARITSPSGQVTNVVRGLRNHASNHQFFSAMTQAFDSLGLREKDVASHSATQVVHADAVDGPAPQNEMEGEGSSTTYYKHQARGILPPPAKPTQNNLTTPDVGMPYVVEAYGNKVSVSPLAEPHAAHEGEGSDLELEEDREIGLSADASYRMSLIAAAWQDAGLEPPASWNKWTSQEGLEPGDSQMYLDPSTHCISPVSTHGMSRNVSRENLTHVIRSVEKMVSISPTRERRGGSGATWEGKERPGEEHEQPQAMEQQVQQAFGPTQQEDANLNYPDPSWAGGRRETVGKEARPDFAGPPPAALCVRLELDFRLSDLSANHQAQEFCKDLVIDLAEALYVSTDRLKVVSLHGERVLATVLVYPPARGNDDERSALALIHEICLQAEDDSSILIEEGHVTCRLLHVEGPLKPPQDAVDAHIAEPSDPRDGADETGESGNDRQAGPNRSSGHSGTTRDGNGGSGGAGGAGGAGAGGGATVGGVISTHMQEESGVVVSSMKRMRPPPSAASLVSMAGSNVTDRHGSIDFGGVIPEASNESRFTSNESAEPLTPAWTGLLDTASNMTNERGSWRGASLATKPFPSMNPAHSTVASESKCFTKYPDRPTDRIDDRNYQTTDFRRRRNEGCEPQEAPRRGDSKDSTPSSRSLSDAMTKVTKSSRRRFKSDASTADVDVELELVLDMEIDDIRTLGAEVGVSFDDALDDFRDAISCDVAHAVGGRRDKVHVLGLRAGSVIVHLLLEAGICGKQMSPFEAATLLQSQILDTASPLKQGMYTCCAQFMVIKDTITSALGNPDEELAAHVTRDAGGMNKERQVDKRRGSLSTTPVSEPDFSQSTLNSTQNSFSSITHYQQQQVSPSMGRELAAHVPHAARNMPSFNINRGGTPEDDQDRELALPTTCYCHVDMLAFPRLHGYLLMSSDASHSAAAKGQVEDIARKNSLLAEYSATRKDSSAVDLDLQPSADKENKKKNLWDKLKNKIRGKKGATGKKKAVAAYQKLWFEIDPVRFQLAWCKDSGSSEEDKDTLDLKHCVVAECRFEDVKRQHVFQVSESRGQHRRLLIGASDIEEYEIWQTTLKTMTEKPSTDVSTHGSKEEKVWSFFVELLRRDIARCLSRYHAVRWDQVQVRVLWEDMWEQDCAGSVPSIPSQNGLRKMSSVSGASAPERYRYVARISFEAAEDVGSANEATELYKMFRLALSGAASGNMSFLKWRPGSCKLKSILCDGHWSGGHLHFLAGTSSNLNIFADGQRHKFQAEWSSMIGSADESLPVHNKEDHAVAVDHSRYASRDSSRRGPFEGVLAVLVHSIVDFSDTAGFMDKTDPFVELKVGHRKVRITERDSKKMNPKNPSQNQLFSHLLSSLSVSACNSRAVSPD